MADPDGRHIADALALRVSRGATSADIAETLAATWREVDEALSPIVGRQGVAALYQRSLHLTAAEFPWFATISHGMQGPLDIEALHSVLASHPPPVAAAGGGALLQAFHRLVAGMIGPALTGQLLHAIWAQFPRDPSAQDHP